MDKQTNKLTDTEVNVDGNTHARHGYTAVSVGDEDTN